LFEVMFVNGGGGPMVRPGSGVALGVSLGVCSVFCGQRCSGCPMVRFESLTIRYGSGAGGRFSVCGGVRWLVLAIAGPLWEECRRTEGTRRGCRGSAPSGLLPAYFSQAFCWVSVRRRDGVVGFDPWLCFGSVRNFDNEGAVFRHGVCPAWIDCGGASGACLAVGPVCRWQVRGLPLQWGCCVSQRMCSATHGESMGSRFGNLRRGKSGDAFVGISRGCC